MKKIIFSVLAASSLLVTNASVDAHSATSSTSNAGATVLSQEFDSTFTNWADLNTNSPYSYQAVQKVSSSKATAKSGTFKTKYNSNVRVDAGTKNRIVTTAKKGSTAIATHQKKVGNEVWYKINVNGKSGWVLNSLLSPVAAKKAPAKAAATKSANLGTFKTKYSSNVRTGAGTKNRIVTLAKAGTTVKATAQTKVGNQVWYKISVNGKTGWISGSLLTKTTAAKAPAKAPAKSSAVTGTFKTKYNSNVRSAAGTKNKILTLAKTGTTVKATAQTKVGSQVWYKVNVNGKTGWISGLALAKATAAKPATVSKVSNSSASSSSLVSTALSLQGTPYRFGGSTTSGFDCSGFVQYVFKQSGKSMSRSTLTQFAETKTVSTPQPGDLVFFQNTYRPGISHVGIYIGNNQFVHSGGQKAEVKSLSDSYWKTKIHSFKRK